jgi:hypothetical protein
MRFWLRNEHKRRGSELIHVWFKIERNVVKLFSHQKKLIEEIDDYFKSPGPKTWKYVATGGPSAISIGGSSPGKELAALEPEDPDYLAGIYCRVPGMAFNYEEVAGSKVNCPKCRSAFLPYKAWLAKGGAAYKEPPKVDRLGRRLPYGKRR